MNDQVHRDAGRGRAAPHREEICGVNRPDEAHPAIDRIDEAHRVSRRRRLCGRGGPRGTVVLGEQGVSCFRFETPSLRYRRRPLSLPPSAPTRQKTQVHGFRHRDADLRYRPGLREPALSASTMRRTAGSPKLPRRYVVELALKRLFDDLDRGQLKLDLAGGCPLTETRKRAEETCY